MSDWVEKLDAFLKFTEYDILHDAGNVRANVGKAIAEKEYEKFRVIQDKEYKSDFDKVVEDIKEKQKLPSEPVEPKKPKTNFDKMLIGLIKTPPPRKGKKK